MANKFEMQITAVDRATAVINRVNASMSEMGKPVTETTKRMKAMTTALGRNPIAKTMGEIGKSGLLIARNLGAAVPAFEAMTGAGAIAGVTALAVGAERVAAAWGRAGYNMRNASQMSGLGPVDLQKLQGAAKLSGLDKDAASAGAQGLYKAIIDARTNDPTALTALKTFGVDPFKTDTMSALLQISRGISSGKIDPVRQREAMAMLGLQDMLPLLQRGPAGIQSLMNKTAQYGGIANAHDVANATRLADSTNELEMKIMGKLGQAKLNTIDAVMNSTSLFDFANRLGRGGVSHYRYNGQTHILGQLPAGLRRNNPGNLRSWAGADSEGGFAKFSSVEEGARAMSAQLGLYAKRGNDTLSGIIGTYAPGNENNTGAYIADVAKRTGYDPNTHLDMSDPAIRAKVMGAMITHEQGIAPNMDALMQIVRQQMQEPQKMEITLHGLPAGVTATARNQHGNVPVKVATAMPVGGP